MITKNLRVSLDEYDRMIREGAFDGENHQRVELIRGEIRPMSPIGAAHEDIVDYLADWSHSNAPHDQVRIRIQNSVGLSGLESVPQPDVVWAVQKSYRRRRPQAEDLFLVIEVAGSSLRGDMGEKANLYAEAGVADYWVVDVFGRRVAVFREPKGGKYSSPAIVEPGGVVSPLRFPAIELAVAEMFPEDD